MKQIFCSLFILTIILNTYAQSDVTEVNKNAALVQALQDVKSSGGGSFVSFSSKEDTKGSRYFFTTWVKGSVVDVTNTLYNEHIYFYNYDKISHHVFMTSNKKDVIELDADKLKSFTLNNNTGADYNFEKVASLDPVAFFQAIVKDSAKYSAYKLIKTKFIKANYHTDGMVETGKNYDEYVDETEYYVGFKNADFKPVDLNKKSLGKALAENPKVQSYFKEHKEDEINESFLLDFITFLNKN